MKRPRFSWVIQRKRIKKEPVIVVVVLSLFYFMSQTVATHKVDGESMAPTFHTGDRIIIEKRTHIQRYEVVTFEPKVLKGESFMKRVIGLPGDRIRIENNLLYILPKESRLDGRTAEETLLADGTIVVSIIEGVAKRLSTYQEIPAGHYFVLGDNRHHSDDSRLFGFVEKEAMEGVVLYRYYPLNRMGLIH